VYYIDYVKMFLECFDAFS